MDDEIDFRREDINYAQILRLQLNRVGIAGIMRTDVPQGRQAFSPFDYVEITIDVLACLLFPYIDDNFKELKNKATNNEGRIAPMDLLRCCVDLMHRRGLLLREYIEERE
jgi:hypothetical protein